MRKLKTVSSFLITLVILSVSGFLTAGCSWFSEKDTSTDPARVERTDAQIFVGDTIEMNYDPNVILKRAESFHEKEGYAEAIVEYQHFWNCIASTCSPRTRNTNWHSAILS